MLILTETQNPTTYVVFPNLKPTRMGRKREEDGGKGEEEGGEREQRGRKERI